MARIYQDPSIPETINTIPIQSPPPIPSFDITPHGPTVAIATSYASYSYDLVTVNSQVVVPAMYNHLSNIVLTFTGAFFDPQGGSISEWFWQFGDGATGSGSTVTHTYKYPDPSLVVHLRVTTTDNRVGWTSMNPMLTGGVGGIGYSYLSLQFFYATYTSMQAAFATYDALRTG